MSFEKLAELRNEMQPGERDRRADAESTLEACTKTLSDGVCLVRFRKRANGALVERDARFGRCYPPRGAREKADAQSFLELHDLGDPLRDRRLADAETPPGGRERSALHHAREDLHGT